MTPSSSAAFPDRDAELDLALHSLTPPRYPPQAKTRVSRPRRGSTDAYLARLTRSGAVRPEQRRDLLRIKYTVRHITDPGRYANAPGSATARQGSVAVPAATMEYLDQHAGLRERLGLPLRRPLTSAADELVQFFENGVVTTRDGIPAAYLRAVLPPEPEEDPQRVRLVALNFSPETVARGEPIQHLRLPG